MDVEMFSSAPYTLCLYIEVNAHMQDRFHPVVGCAPPSSRQRRLASRKCEEMS